MNKSKTPSENNFITDIDLRKIIQTCNENINKLQQEINQLKKNQINSNERNKNDHNEITKELDNFKTQVLNYQFIISTQIEKIANLENELDKLKELNLNKTIKFTKEISINKAKVKPKILETVINEIKTNVVETNDTLEVVKEEISILPEKLCESIEMPELYVPCSDNMNFLISIKNYEAYLENSQTSDVIKNSFNIFKNEIITGYRITDRKLDESIELIKNLENKNIQLNEKLSNYETEFNKSKDCSRCGQSFLPKTNDEESCYFHTGKIMYYSCRGCGEDEYFTCCRKCSKCSLGCMTAKHISS